MVKRFFRNSTSILFRRQKTLLSAAVIMMFLIFASRVLGLVRNWFLAGTFGAGPELDAYNAGFVLPDLIAIVLINGALSVAFIPIFTTYLTQKGSEEAWEMGSSVLNLSLLVFLAFGIIIFLFPQQLNSLIVPGLDPETAQTAANMTRIVAFGEIFLVIGSFLTATLQSYHRFIAPALAPVAYNLGIIFGIVFLSKAFGIYGVGFGVVIGAFFHFLLQFLMVRRFGYKYSFKLDFKNLGFRKVIKLSIPRSAGIGLAQLELTVSIFLASLLASGSIAILRFSIDIQNLPIALFGSTIAVAAFPTLSSEWAGNKLEQFKATFLSSLHQILYLAIPLSIIFVTLRIPIVRLTLGSGLFDWEDTVATATTLSFFSFGVFAQAGFLLVSRAFYSMHDTVTPLRVALASLAIHVIAGIMFMLVLNLPIQFLGLASAISGVFSFFVLLAILDRKLGGFDRRKLFIPVVKIVTSAFVMAVILYIPLHFKIGEKYIIDFIIDTTRAINLLFLTLFVAFFGFAIYVLLTWWFKSEELKSFLGLIPDFKKFTKALNFEEVVDTDTTPKS
ncbi:murein biosynthesis integral membrane protein MurJ [Patescibacteria group bacterium]|nr:murein biosynthesis integral membrane protein MurJ [Patescibacteria group bacterium]